jgi:hypothetical protein
MKDTVYMRPRLEDIRASYLRYWLSDEARRKAAALWGCDPDTDVNSSGVFVNVERLAFSAGRTQAEIQLARASGGLWAKSTSYQTPSGGGGYAPSIWHPVAYASRESARNAALEELWHIFTTARDQTEDDRRMLELLDEARHEQLSLF